MLAGLPAVLVAGALFFARAPWVAVVVAGALVFALGFWGSALRVPPPVGRPVVPLI